MGRRRHMTSPSHRVNEHAQRAAEVHVGCVEGLDALWKKRLGRGEGPQEGSYEQRDLLGPLKPGEADPKSFCNRRVRTWQICIKM